MVDKSFLEGSGISNKNMTEEKIKKECDDADKDSLSKLKQIYRRVKFLKITSEKINDDESKISGFEEYKKLDFEDNDTPKKGSVLWDYIMLEIDTFYHIVHIYMGQGRSFPVLPTYLAKLRKYRNKMPGHRDDKNEFSTLWSTYLFLKDFEKYPNSDRVVDDFFKYCEKIF